MTHHANSMLVTGRMSQKKDGRGKQTFFFRSGNSLPLPPLHIDQIMGGRPEVKILIFENEGMICG